MMPISQRMTYDVSQTVPPSTALSGRPHLNKVEVALLALGLLVMYVPTYIALDKHIWSIVGQGHGPVMLALTLWLVYQRWSRFAELPALAARSAVVCGTLSLLFGLATYVLGRSQGHFGLHVGSQIFVLTALVLLYRGWPGFRVMLFPLAFSLTLVPLPGALVDALTGPLKAAVSYVAEILLYKAGYPIGRTGVMLTIGQYQLLVADACAGLNSIFSLEAIGIFYMSIVQHSSKLRNVLLAVLIVPISFVSNVVRVITLVLVTYYLGDAVGQGFVHEFAGILLFMVATVLTIMVDSFLGLFFKKNKVEKKDVGV